MLTFLGDVALLEGSRGSEYKPNTPYIFNCEYVIGGSDLRPVPGKINLKSTVSDFELMFGENPIAVSISNNHINDFGSHGAQITNEHLMDKGIQIIGPEPIRLGNANLMAFMDLNTKNPEDERFLFTKDKVLLQIDKLKKNESKIIVLMHWGIENDPNPTARQRDVGHWLIDNGVDLVIGHHPHCIQTVEKYNGKYIFYSLGNGYFPSFNQESHFTALGQPTRKYRFNWCKWNRFSYAVTIDDDARIDSVRELYQNRNNILCEYRIVEENELINKRDLPRVVYNIRKYLLFLKSNCFVDGKIIDFKAIKAEISNV